MLHVCRHVVHGAACLHFVQVTITHKLLFLFICCCAALADYYERAILNGVR